MEGLWKSYEFSKQHYQSCRYISSISSYCCSSDDTVCDSLTLEIFLGSSFPISRGEAVTTPKPPKSTLLIAPITPLTCAMAPPQHLQVAKAEREKKLKSLIGELEIQY